MAGRIWMWGSDQAESKPEIVFLIKQFLLASLEHRRYVTHGKIYDIRVHVTLVERLDP